MRRVPSPTERPGAGFALDDRQALLSTRGIGPLVVNRLEQAGYCSLEQLRRAGADTVTAIVCAQVGSTAWANRRRAIRRVLEG
jgi:hypothetical protein